MSRRVRLEGRCATTRKRTSNKTLHDVSMKIASLNCRLRAYLLEIEFEVDRERSTRYRSMPPIRGLPCTSRKMVVSFLFTRIHVSIILICVSSIKEETFVALKRSSPNWKEFNLNIRFSSIRSPSSLLSTCTCNRRNIELDFSRKYIHTYLDTEWIWISSG